MVRQGTGTLARHTFVPCLTPEQAWDETFDDALASSRLGGEVFFEPHHAPVLAETVVTLIRL
jgi:hypothetical protein